jgi:hypothetical protein
MACIKRRDGELCRAEGSDAVSTGDDYEVAMLSRPWAG